MLADYYRYISYLDLLIGRVLDTLDASPAAKNTVVIFAADSGVARGSHGLIGKQNLYEHSMRVPLIIAGPGIPANQRTDAMCYLFDVIPTLGALSGVAGPKTSEGRDLSATLRNPATPARTSLMFAYQKVQRSLRDERYKLIRYPQVDRTQLFDLVADPDERTDLSARPEHSARITAMTAALAAEMKRVDDPAELTVASPARQRGHHHLLASKNDGANRRRWRASAVRTATSWTVVAVPAAVNTGQICSCFCAAGFAIFASP